MSDKLKSGSVNLGYTYSEKPFQENVNIPALVNKFNKEIDNGNESKFNNRLDTSKLQENIQPVRSVTKNNDNNNDNGQEIQKYPPEIKTEVHTPKLRLWSQIMTATGCGLAQFSTGVIIGYPGVMMPALMNETSDDIILDEYQSSMYSSVFLLVAMVSGLLNGLFTIRFGQRKLILLICPILLLAWTAHSLAPYVWVLQVSRLVLGFCMGATSFPAYSFVSEISHPKYKLLLCGLVDLLRQTGFLWVYSIGSTRYHWRQITLICSFPAPILSFILIFMSKSSPRWLVLRNKSEDALKALKFYRGKSFDSETELEHVVSQLPSSDKKISFKKQFELLLDKSVLKRFFILAFIFCGIQFSGGIVVLSYAATLFQSMPSFTNPYISTILIGLVRVLSIFLYSILSYRFEIKKLLLACLMICGISMTCLGIFTYLDHKQYVLDNFNWMPLTFLLAFVIAGCVAVPISNGYRNELLPNAVRHLSHSFLSILFSGAAFLILYSFQHIKSWIGLHWCFVGFGGISLVLCLCAYILLPETKGMSLEEIDDEYRGVKSNKQQSSSALDTSQKTA